MNKGELVTTISERTDVSKADVERVLKLLRSGNTAQAIQMLELCERTLFLQLQDLSS